MNTRIKIDPLDLQPAKGIGVSLPFTGPGVFTTTYETSQAIKFNLVNLLLTSFGERYFNLNLGTSLRSFLFENITEFQIQAAKDLIIESVQSYYPRVSVTSFNINFEPEENTLTIEFKYKIEDTNILDEILINIEQ